MKKKREVLFARNRVGGGCCDKYCDYQFCTCIQDAVYEVGDEVYKVGGDYSFNGIIVAAFKKRNGVMRYVVENGDGLLHIFNGNQLMLRGFDERGRSVC